MDSKGKYEVKILLFIFHQMVNFGILSKSMGSKIITTVGGRSSLPWVRQGLTYEQWKEKTKKATEENKRK